MIELAVGEPLSSTLQVVRLDAVADSRVWDAYLTGRTGSITDLSGWRRVLQDAYGIRSHFLAVQDGRDIIGSLGLYQIRHPVFGHYLTTAPFGTDGGLHYDSPSALRALMAAAHRLADDLQVSYFVTRTRTAAPEGLVDDTRYRTAVLDLDGGAEAVWKHLPAKTRNQVRRGQKEGFTVSVGPDQLGAFYEVFHRHMRDLGSPAHSRAFYHAILEHLGDRAQFIVVRDHHDLVAGALVFRVGATSANYHTVALRQYNRRCPNYLLYWSMIEAACADGSRWFDMGRSLADAPGLQFKSNWNTREIVLHYAYGLRTRRAPPDLDPRNPSFRAAVAVWQKLPLAFTKRLGPRLITGLA